MAFKYAKTTGRLILAHIWSPHSEDDFIGFVKQLNEEIARAGERYVALVDARDAAILPPDIAADSIPVMQRNNERLIRSAWLLGTSSTSALQVGRMAALAQNPQRRSFRDVAECAAWLEEVLEPAEKSALHAFLSRPR